MSQRSLRIKQIRKQLQKQKIAKSLPTIGSKVHIKTKYGTEHDCIYNFKSFKPLNKPYDIKVHEVISWEYIKGDSDAKSNSN